MGLQGYGLWDGKDTGYGIARIRGRWGGTDTPRVRALAGWLRLSERCGRHWAMLTAGRGYSESSLPRRRFLQLEASMPGPFAAAARLAADSNTELKPEAADGAERRRRPGRRRAKASGGEAPNRLVERVPASEPERSTRTRTRRPDSESDSSLRSVRRRAQSAQRERAGPCARSRRRPCAGPAPQRQPRPRLFGPGATASAGPVR
jgi:hypothetical protein